MLEESRLFNFINKDKTFSISFLEGQKIIHDLALIHSVNNKGFSFFRDSTLSILPLINFLKPHENMGIFIDSDNPYLRFKLEMNSVGLFRTLILPEELEDIPNKISGNLRTAKQFPSSKVPYTSVIEVKNKSVVDLMNSFFTQSYQMNSQLLLSSTSDQVLLITKLPEVNVDKEEVVKSKTMEEFINEINPLIENVFERALNKESDIKESFQDMGFEFLKSTEVKFHCNCSRHRMVSGVAGLVKSSGFADVFENDETIETKCDYCKTSYLITKDEISNLLNPH